MRSGCSSACRAKTGSSRWCRTVGSIRSGFIPRTTAAHRQFTLTTGSSSTQTGMQRRRPRQQRSKETWEGVMEEVLTEDQSHYEISLTAGQAFVAFVLLLLSLAASFAFGLVIGKGQADERLLAKKDSAFVNEATVIPKKSPGKVVELGVSGDDFKAP